MPITLDTLQAAARRGRAITASNLSEATARGMKTAFLCHSHKDTELAKGLERVLNDAGWSVYIDWQDVSMPETPNRETARKIQLKIQATHYFLFLATSNSVVSRWCPWEIGYADGMKPIEKILIVPTSDGVTTHGNEYLQLYRRIDYLADKTLGSWKTGDTHGTKVQDL